MTAFGWGSATHVGMTRTINQDAFSIRDGLWIVADGMGGHQGGEVAADLAVTTVRERADDADDDPLTTDAIVGFVEAANDVILDRATDDPDLRGMGTTLCAVALVDADGEERLALLNVGDSRIYRLRAGRLEQMTDDHSLVGELVRDGKLTPAQAETHPQRNIVTRALGIERRLPVDHWEIDPVAGDRYLLCSDGLFGEVAEATITRTLGDLDDPDAAAGRLVELANAAGGHDNTTCVIVDVLSDDGRAVRASAAVRDEPGGWLDRDSLPTEDQAAAPDRDDGSDTDRDRDNDEGGPRLRRITWRTALFAGAIVVVLAVSATLVGIYARNTYFVGVDGEDVVIFQGRADGLLWFDPTVAEATGLTLGDLPDRFHADIEDGRTHADLTKARAYLENLVAIEERESGRSTTTTETTAAAGAPIPPGVGTPSGTGR